MIKKKKKTNNITFRKRQNSPSSLVKFLAGLNSHVFILSCIHSLSSVQCVTAHVILNTPLGRKTFLKVTAAELFL